jgi:hypothetical protein
MNSKTKKIEITPKDALEKIVGPIVWTDYNTGICRYAHHEGSPCISFVELNKGAIVTCLNENCQHRTQTRFASSMLIDLAAHMSNNNRRGVYLFQGQVNASTGDEDQSRSQSITLL